MKATERANLPRWKGQDGFYEIWFLVVFEPGAGRAYWFRYTTFAPAPGTGDDRRAMLWAAAFDAAAEPKTVVAKSIFDDVDYVGGTDQSFHVRIGPADIGHGFCRGEASSDHHSISWQLHFRPQDAVEPRTPRALRALPLPVEAHHAHCEVEMDGWVTIDGVRHEVLGGTGLQMHLCGTRRVEELFWVYAPWFDEVTGIAPDTHHGDATPAVEVTSARLVKRVRGFEVPRVSSLWMSGDPALARPSLSGSRGVTITEPRPGMLRVALQSATRRVVLRAWAPLDAFVGYRYRDPSGDERAVAQSDIASCYVEVFERKRRLGAWSPRTELTSRSGAALELHGDEARAGIPYVEWLATAARAPSAPATPPPLPSVEPPSGRFLALPAPTTIYALGLTYREHVEETGGFRRRKPQGPAVFRKDTAAWLPRGETVRVPRSARLLQVLDGLEPGLAAEVSRRVPFLPAMMDYEVELGVMVLDDVTDAHLEAGGELPRLGFFVANDLTARSVQVLGEGQPDPMPYWTLAKSLEGFLPVSDRLWVSDRRAEEFPEVELCTRVNGEVRQRASTAGLALSPRQALRAVMRSTQRDLRRGDVVLTGTPSGVAFRVSRAKRMLGDALLGRFGKLTAALAAYAESPWFVGPGDEIEVDGGWLGTRRIRLEL